MPSVLVMARSATWVMLSMSVAGVLLRLLSVLPGGGGRVAGLSGVGVAVGGRLGEKERVRLGPTGRSTLVLKAPVPLLGLPEVMAPPPLPPVKVQLSLVTPTGTASKTLAPLATLGP